MSLLPAYWRFLDQATSDRRAAALLFRRLVIAPNQQVYDAVAADWMDDIGLERFTAALGDKTGSIRRAEGGFLERFQVAWADFGRTFEDLSGNVTVYLIPAPSSAVGGAVRPFGGEDVMIFGAEDFAVETDLPTGPKASIEHELTHLYQAQVNSEIRGAINDFFMNHGSAKEARLYQMLWLEGLATYVSRVLNPDASERKVLRSETLRADVQVRWPALRQAILDHLDSTEEADIKDFVFGGSRLRAIPPRTGYYVGMLAAERLAKKYSLTELARLHGAGFRRELEISLRELQP